LEKKKFTGGDMEKLNDIWRLVLPSKIWRKTRKENPLKAYLQLLPYFIVLLLILAISFPVEKDNAKFWFDLGLKVVAGLVAIGVALWRWQPIKDKAEEDVYLRVVETLKGENTQASYIGASYQLLHLAERNSKYISPATLIIESAIRDISEKNYNKWTEYILDADVDKLKHYSDKEFLPAIKVMVAIVLKIREREKYCKPPLPDIDFRRADLRGLQSDDFKEIENYREKLLSANFRNADLRGVNLDLTTTTSGRNSIGFSKLDGTWIGMTNSRFGGKNATVIKLEKESNESAENSLYPDIENIKYLIEMGARLFLLGSWSFSNSKSWSSNDKENDLFQFGENNKLCKIVGGPGVDLSGMDLSSCDLSNSHLAGANFQEAILTGSIFTVANIRGADFRGVKSFKDADFAGSNYREAFFGKIDEAPLDEDKDIDKFLRTQRVRNL